MKIIDKTPLLDEKGNLAFMQRVQGMLQFGFNWPRELEAQSTIIKFFEKELGKNYNLIRNIALGASGITIPMVLIGSTGIYVIEVSHLRGRYEAKGEEWNVEAGDGYKPAPVNLIRQTMRMARALDAFITRQGVRIPVEIEPVIIAADPGLHIESSRPAIRVMMVDGIRAFVSGLSAGSPALNSMQINDFTDRILTPRPKMEAPPPEPESEPEPDPSARWQETYEPAQSFQSAEPEPFFQPQDFSEPSHASVSFETPAENGYSFNPNDIGFALGNEAEVFDIPPVRREEPELLPASPLRNTKPKQNLVMGMTTNQLMVIGGLALVFVCLVVILAYVALF